MQKTVFLFMVIEDTSWRYIS